jgi:hypothetical protein
VSEPENTPETEDEDLPIAAEVEIEGGPYGNPDDPNVYEVLCYTESGERQHIECRAKTAKEAISVARQAGFMNVRSVAQMSGGPEPIGLGDPGPDDSGDQ